MNISIMQTKYEEGAITVFTEPCTSIDHIDITIETSKDEQRTYLLSYPRHQLDALAKILTEIASKES